jgi:hypothetical protein
MIAALERPITLAVHAEACPVGEASRVSENSQSPASHVVYLPMAGISVSSFICAFCGRRTPIPFRPEGEAYEAVGMYAVNRCPCGTVAFCQADAALPRENWPRAQIVEILCREVLKLEPGGCEVRRNLTTAAPQFEVVWARPK